jgi:hypothetical protein
MIVRKHTSRIDRRLLLLEYIDVTDGIMMQLG